MRERQQQELWEILPLVIIHSHTSGQVSINMAGRPSRTRAKGKGKAKATLSAVPEPFRQLMAEALPTLSTEPERPLKKRKTHRREEPSSLQPPTVADENDDEVEDIEFEDVLNAEFLPLEIEQAPKKLQTAYRDSEEESDGSDVNWDPIDFDIKPDEEVRSGDLELTLIKPSPQKRIVTPRRKAIPKQEKDVRLQIHRMHLLCLLVYVERRNEWCNDLEVQRLLKPLLTKKMLKYIRPKSDLSQFGQTNSLTNGLKDIANMWATKFKISERGMRRPLWAEHPNDLNNVSNF